MADLIVPDRDYFACAEREISEISSVLTIVGGRVVYAAGDFAALDDSPPPPPMPDWSPVRTFGGYAAWADDPSDGQSALFRRASGGCGCSTPCGVHGHDHATAWSARLPAGDLKAFWGALGCACWAV